MEELVLKIKTFLGIQDKEENKEEENENEIEEIKEPEKIGYLNNLIDENGLLNECGLGFSDEESYLIYTSIKNFNKKHGSSKTIFWGKIFGVHADYYVIESESNNLEIEIKDLEVIS